MYKEQQKKTKMLELFVFCAILLFIITFFMNVTLSWLFGTDESATGNIVVARVGVTTTCPLNFDDIILPATTYSGANYNTTIQNSGNSGPIFLKVKIVNSHAANMTPIISSSSLWALGGADNNEYYYLSALNLSNTITFLTGFTTLNNFTNGIAGDTLNISLTVYAIQAQYGAYADATWTNAYTPAAFTTFANNYS